MIRKSIRNFMAWRRRKALERSIKGYAEAERAERLARAKHGPVRPYMERKRQLIHDDLARGL